MFLPHLGKRAINITILRCLNSYRVDKIIPPIKLLVNNQGSRASTNFQYLPTLSTNYSHNKQTIRLNIYKSLK